MSLSKRVEERGMDDCTSQLGIDYERWKFFERQKNAGKDRFFELATEACQEQDAPEHYAEMQATDEAEARLRFERYYPRHYVDALRKGSVRYEAILRLKPEYQSFTYINVNDGHVYQRQVTKGSVVLDDERLLAENPQLHEEVTYELPWGDRIVRPLDTLDTTYLSLLNEYLHEGKPSVKLAAPRLAKEQELESVAS